VIAERIFQHAVSFANRPAALLEDQIYTYQHLATLLHRVRSALAEYAIPAGTDAVCWAPRPLGQWVLCLALRSLGVNVLPSPIPQGPKNSQDIEYFVTIGLPTLPADAQEFRFHFDIAPGSLDQALREAASPPETMAGPDVTTIGGHFLLSSGTTGVYKRVLVDAATEAIIVERYCLSHQITDQTVSWNGFGPWTMWGYGVASAAWAVGGTVQLHWATSNYNALWREEMNLAVITPGMLAEALLLQPARCRSNRAMRLLIGGSAFPRNWTAAARRQLSSVLVNAFGCTEVGPVAFTEVHRDEDADRHRLQPFSEVQIVDDNHQPLRPGQIGMIRIRSVGSLDHYVGDEATTRQFFRDGYFYTGDLGLFDDDGMLVFHGRVSDVINLAGEKISPVPIEEALETQLGVPGIAVFGVSGNRITDDLHVVIESSTPLDESRLETARKDVLRNFLAVHFHYRDSLPRTDLGKLQRQNLRRMILDG